MIEFLAAVGTVFGFPALLGLLWGLRGLIRGHLRIKSLSLSMKKQAPELDPIKEMVQWKALRRSEEIQTWNVTWNRIDGTWPESPRDTSPTTDQLMTWAQDLPIPYPDTPLTEAQYRRLLFDQRLAYRGSIPISDPSRTRSGR